MPQDSHAKHAWPLFRSLASYSLPGDLMAGLTLAAIAIPEQMATARLGGFAPQSSFVEEAGDLLRDAQAFHGVLLRRFPNTLMTRLAPSLAEPVGVFAQCAALRDAAPRDLKHLIRRLKIRRTLDARAQKLV